MKIALTKKNYDAKRRKQQILEHHFLKKIKVEKAPRETPPPLPPSFPPAVNQPPHAKMKHTGEADAPVPEFAARWRARREHLNKSYSTKYEEQGKKEKNDPLVHVPK